MNSIRKFAALALATVVGLSLRAANVWYVDAHAAAGGNGSEASPYKTIQDAINAATTLAGDTILVRPGDYTEGGKSYGSTYTQRNRVYVTKKNLTIKSTGGKEVTHIVGGADNTACVMSDSTGIVFEGFTLRDGVAVTASGAAGGISAGGSGWTTNRYALVDCVISNCTGKTGAMTGGIAVRCRISNNSAWNYGTVTGSSLYNCIVENQVTGPYVLMNCGAVVNTAVVNNRCGTQTCYSDAGKVTADGGGHYYNSVIYGNGKAFTDAVGVYANCVADGSATGVTSVPSNDLFVNLYMSPVTGDYRPVTGGFLAGRGDKTICPEVIPEAYRDFDFAGHPLAAGAAIPIGVIIAAATPADVGVGVVANLRLKFNGHTAASGFHVHLSDVYPSSVYVQPADEITNSLAAISINGYGSMTSPLHHWLGVRKGVWITPPPAGAKSKTGTDLGPVPVYGQSVSKHLYVDCNLESYADHDGSSWTLAFATIQEAVNSAAGSATWIHVRAGDYGTGGANDTTIAGGYGRVVVDTGTTATLISSEGDVAHTIIRGAFGSGSYGSGDGAARCLILKGSKLGVTGFTLTGGACSNTSNTYGGGVYAADNNVVVSDCIVENCYGYNCSAAYQGTLMRCLFRNNTSRVCTTRNGVSVACVYKSNFSNPTSCHGAYTSHQCVGCTFYDPTATSDSLVNNENTDLFNCAFAAGGHLLNVANVACEGNVAETDGLKTVDAGWNGRMTVGELRLTAPATDDFRPFVTSACIGAGALASSARPYEWTSRYVGFDFENNPVLTAAGQVVAGAVATVRQPVSYYADANRTSPSGDGLSEATAKKTLAEAMTLPLLYGDEVVALPGTYADGSQLHTFKAIGSATPTIRSRVVVPSGVTLRSRDGAATTFIAGQDATSGADDYGRGTDAIRGAAVEAGATLRGFTIYGGRTAASDSSYVDDQTGGGVIGKSYVDSRVEDCVLSNNVASCGGGASFVNCSRCRFVDNTAPRYGSGARYVSLYNCFFSGNLGPRVTEVLYDCVNCTYCDNYALNGTSATPTFQNMGDCENLVNVLVCGLVVTTDNSAGNDLKAKKIRNCVFPKVFGVVPGRWSSDTNAIDQTQTLDQLRTLFPNGRALTREAPTVDAGLDLAAAGDRDVLGADRVQNAALDIGAFEYDWKGDYGAALGKRVTVTAADGVVETGDTVALSPAGELALTWSMSDDGSAPDGWCVVPVALTGTGTLYIYLNGAATPLAALTASGDVRFRNDRAQDDLVLKYVGDGVATLGRFRREMGFTIFVR